MSEKSKQFRIDRFDFGFSGSQRSSKNRQNLPKQLKLFSKKSFIKGLHSIGIFTKKTFQVLYSSFGKIKWKVSRSIFLGRGVYFKYISNLSIVIIVVFGTFVYLGFEASQGKKGFISKFSNVASANEAVLFSAGGQTVLNQKEFNVVKYVVNGGDTLSGIAQKYSTPDNLITVDTILWANALKSTDLLRPGMVLDIPPVQGTMHTVKKGDTVIALAKTYGKITEKSSPENIIGVTQEITDINLLDVKVDGDSRMPVLVEGQKIIIPGGVMPEEPKPVFIAAVNAPARAVPISAKPQIIQPVNNTGQKFIWPVAGNRGVITQYFSQWHTAIDVADSSGPPLVSIASGTVVSSGWQKGGGANVVTIKFDGGGYSALYAHMASISVSAGDRVEQGQVIGRMGCTGSCTGTHVHFSLFNNGVNVNPYLYVVR